MADDAAQTPGKLAAAMGMHDPNVMPRVQGKWRGTAQFVELEGESGKFPGIVLDQRTPVGDLTYRRVEPTSDLYGDGVPWPPVLANTRGHVLHLPEVSAGDQLEIAGFMLGGSRLSVFSREKGKGGSVTWQPPDAPTGTTFSIRTERIWRITEGSKRELIYATPGG